MGDVCVGGGLEETAEEKGRPVPPVDPSPPYDLSDPFSLSRSTTTSTSPSMATNISTPTPEDAAAATAEEVASFFPAPAAWDFSKCPTVVVENDARDGSLLGPSNFYRDCRWCIQSVVLPV